MAIASSSPPPPRNVAHTTLPLVSSLAAHASMPPPSAPCSALTIGKSVDDVPPATHTLPMSSTAMALAKSSPAPPRNVQYATVEPSALSLTTKASLPVRLMPLQTTALLFGNAGDAV